LFRTRFDVLFVIDPQNFRLILNGEYVSSFNILTSALDGIERTITHFAFGNIVIPELLTFYDRQYRYEVKQLNKEAGNERK
jgi:hypothetical protein